MTSEVPPKAPELPQFTESASTTGEVVPETQVERVIYWRCPKLTGTIFGVVNFICFLTLFKKYSFLSVFSFCALLFLVGCFIYINGSKLLVGYLGENALPKPTFGLQEFNAEAIHAKVDPAVDSLNSVVQGCLDIVLCKNNVTTLKAIGVLYVLYLVGKVMPDLILFYTIFLIIFTVPKIYEMNKEEIDKAASEAQTKLISEKDKYMKIANERTIEMRATVAKKVQETATPLMEKVQPRINELRKRAAKTTATTATAPPQ